MNYLLILLIVSHIYFSVNALYIDNRKTPSCDESLNEPHKCCCCVSSLESNANSDSNQHDSDGNVSLIALIIGRLFALGMCILLMCSHPLDPNHINL